MDRNEAKRGASSYLETKALRAQSKFGLTDGELKEILGDLFGRYYWRNRVSEECDSCTYRTVAMARMDD